MQQLVYARPGTLQWRDVAVPRLITGVDALVRPVASATCDLDRAIIAGASPFEGPFAIGHECVAEVVDISDGAMVAPGDHVVVPWHPCCTLCAMCRRGLTAHCQRVEELSMYGTPLGTDLGGLFDELVYVPFRAALVPLPSGVAPAAVASASDNLVDAYLAVSRPLQDRAGGSVLVLGGTGSIGQWAAGWAVALGAGRVVYADRDEQSRAVAAGYGAVAVAHEDETAEDRFDVLVDASGSASRLQAALRRVAHGGHCHSVGIYFREPTGLPLAAMYMRAVGFTTGRPSVVPALPEVLDAVAAGRLNPSPVFTHRFSYEQAPEELARLPKKAVFLREDSITPTTPTGINDVG